MTEKINSKGSVIKSKRSFDNLLRVRTEGNNFGMLKTLLILVLFLVEIGIMVLAGLVIASFVRGYLITAAVITIATCIYVLSSNKNSQSKAVWVMFLLLCFSFGYIIFYLSDEHIFFRKQKKRYDEIFKRVNNFQMGSDVAKNLPLDNRRDVEFLEKTGNFAAYDGTDLTYYSSGAKLFDAVLEACKSAQKFIFMEYFIIADGALLTRFENIVKQKCEEGVEVRIIYDDMGSHQNFSRKVRNRLKSYGVKMYKFNQLISWFSFALNYRDHRKIFVVDGKVGFTGGANFADEYINEKTMHGYWKDAGIKLEGIGVDGLTLTFLKQWEFVSKSVAEVSPYIGLAEKTDNTAVVVPFADGLDYEKNISKDAFTNIISNANQKLYIMTPYLVIDDVIFNLIKNKALAGVDVRMIIPDVADKKVVYRVSRNNAEKLAEYGVKLYTMNQAFVHSKVILTENSAIVGSINLDLRSFYQQFENAVYFTDRNAMREILNDFDETIKVSTLITPKRYYRAKLLNRMIAGLLGIVAPFM